MATAQGGLGFNKEYIRSKPGIFRILEACIGLSGIISGREGAYCRNYSTHTFYDFVAGSSLVFAIIIIIIFTISLDKVCTVINYTLSMLLTDVIFCILWLVATILMFVAIPGCSAGQAARIVAAIFGILGTIVLGLLAHANYMLYRGGTSSSSA